MAQLSAERLGRITGSRIGSVLGVDKYRTRNKLMREMVAEAKGEAAVWIGNEATEWGQLHEADALAAFTGLTGLPVHSQQEWLIHPQYHFLGVTLDGRVGRHGIVEAKSPLRAKYTRLDQVPHYECQVRLQMECANAEIGYLVIWRPDQVNLHDNTIVLEVQRDFWWLDEHLPTIEAFMAEFKRAVS